MSNTDRMSMLERWADGMETLEQYYEGKYGPPATPPSLPPITTYDAMLEAIADGMERAKRNINKKSTTYHSDSVAYVKTVPAGNVHYASIEQIGGKTLVFNQLVDSGTTTVATISGHKYYTLISGTASIVTGDGSTVSVTGGTDMVCDLTLMFGSGNEPATTTEFSAIFPNAITTYNAGTLLSAGVTEVVSKGKNYLPLPASMNPLDNNGVTVTPHADGSFTVFGTATQNASISWTLAEAIPIPQNAYIHFRNSVSNGSITFTLTDENNVMFAAPGCAPVNRIFSASSYAGRKIAKFGVYVSSGQNANMTIQPSVELSSTATDYTLYKAPIQYPIPAEVRALSGYGWNCPSHYNYIDFEVKKFVQEVGSRAYASGDESDATVITDGTTTYYPLNPAVETDISAYLTDDNLIEVEAGGTLTFENQHGDDYRIPVPSSVTFVVGEP